ncbi:MAG: hypothetical protein WB990_12645 [Candidatus Acidiferrales bacterium]
MSVFEYALDSHCDALAIQADTAAPIRSVQFRGCCHVVHRLQQAVHDGLALLRRQIWKHGQ